MIRLLAIVLCAAFPLSDSYAEIKRWRVGDGIHPWTLRPVTGRLDLGRSWAVEIIAICFVLLYIVIDGDFLYVLRPWPLSSWLHLDPIVPSGGPT